MIPLPPETDCKRMLVILETDGCFADGVEVARMTSWRVRCRD
jgi:formylmethanofuran dehydrogenase subunit E